MRMGQENIEDKSERSDGGGREVEREEGDRNTDRQKSTDK